MNQAGNQTERRRIARAAPRSRPSSSSWRSATSLYGRFVARQLRARRRATDARGARATTASTSCRRRRSTCSASTSPRSRPRGRSPGRSSPCQQFGWLPCAPLDRARRRLHRRGARLLDAGRVGAPRRRSIAEIVRAHLGRRAWLAMMAFIWLALVYVIVAFADITASDLRRQDRGARRRSRPLQRRAARSRSASVALPRPRGGDGARRALPQAAALAAHGDLRAGDAASRSGSAPSSRRVLAVRCPAHLGRCSSSPTASSRR